jgi:hypothetical protein
MNDWLRWHSSHIWFAVLFIYISSNMYICAFLKIFIYNLKFLAFCFHKRHCEQSQNKPSWTEACVRACVRARMCVCVCVCVCVYLFIYFIVLLLNNCLGVQDHYLSVIKLITIFFLEPGLTHLPKLQCMHRHMSTNDCGFISVT